MPSANTHKINNSRIHVTQKRCPPQFLLSFPVTGVGKLTVGKLYGGVLIHDNWKQTKFGQIEELRKQEAELEAMEKEEALAAAEKAAVDAVDTDEAGDKKAGLADMNGLPAVGGGLGGGGNMAADLEDNYMNEADFFEAGHGGPRHGV